MKWFDRLAEIRKYRVGSTIPVYHNLCGNRTTYLPCDCPSCRIGKRVNIYRKLCRVGGYDAG